MKKKDIMFGIATINAVLLCLLFVIGLSTEKKEVALADKLDKSKPAMLQVQPILAESTSEKKLLTSSDEQIVYQLPKAPKPAVVEKVPQEPKAPVPVTPVVKVSEPVKKVEETIVDVTVVKNDTLEALSRKYNSSVDKIIAYNHLKSPLLKIGQKLEIPQNITVVKDKIEPKKEVDTKEFYTVKVGDNPWTIAMKHHMKVSALLKLNNLDDRSSRKIKPGDKLRVR